ncbi:ABC transporter substrate-binding protein [Paenibacillus nanensis]|uniref:ABC transporter substrate-binding protein n=1 Tax=Paenibacillus nanensis TaxID=393251 RepID=A0A3A1UTY1_9BACL|nr:ABC transporter substrate-binding protein [Paenibacillus nanensis]RIX51705.1 ABC transporter substrate-binding protein [Paenibacillus nanensis]
MKATTWTSIKTAMSLMLIMMMVFLAACGGNNGANNGNANNNGTQTEQGASNTPSEEPSEEPSGNVPGETVYPITVTDATGTELTLEKAPTAIVTLVPSETETIFAIGAGKSVVGVDEWSNYPEEAAAVAKIGDMTTNIESVVALNPDLILASSSMNADAIAKLRELNLNVYATNPKTYDEVVAKIEEVGKMVNKQAEAAEVANRMRDVKEQVVSAVKDAEKKKVYLEFSPGYTVGSGEFLDEIVTLAGGINIAASQPGWFEVNAEEVITQNPEIIIYPDFGEEKSSIVAGIEARPGWDAVDAVKNNRLVEVSNDPLVRVGPRLADGLLEVAKAIHPELIK